jgi:Zn-dependent metalloprotease
MSTYHHPINCILPPHILRQIADQGTPQQRNKALQTIDFTGRLRGQRQAFSEVIEVTPAVTAAGKERMVYDAEHGSNLPGRLVRSEGQAATGDPAVDEAYDGSGATYDLYWDAYQRNSIDGNGLRLDSSVHYQVGYDNAFWNGQQMVYGDGDEDLPPEQRLFNRFTIAIDVIGHELTHGVTQYEVNFRCIWFISKAKTAGANCATGRLADRRRTSNSQCKWGCVTVNESSRNRLRRSGAW